MWKIATGVVNIFRGKKDAEKYFLVVKCCDIEFYYFWKFIADMNRWDPLTVESVSSS